MVTDGVGIFRVLVDVMGTMVLPVGSFVTMSVLLFVALDAVRHPEQRRMRVLDTYKLEVGFWLLWLRAPRSSLATLPDTNGNDGNAAQYA